MYVHHASMKVKNGAQMALSCVRVFSRLKYNLFLLQFSSALIFHFNYFEPHLIAQSLLIEHNLAAGLVVSVVDPQPGESIIDCCAAPGGKTIFLASCLSGQGNLSSEKGHILHLKCLLLLKHHVKVLFFSF